MNGLPNRSITQIAFDPNDAAIAYVTFSGFTFGSDTLGHVFKTVDSGSTWIDISGNLPNIPANDIVVDPDLVSTLYLATDVGVFATTDGGRGWFQLGTGLPRVMVMGLKLHRASRVLRAATAGRGMWDILAPPSAISPDFSLSLNQSALTAHPGTKVSLPININRTGGFAGNVTVTPPTASIPGVTLSHDPVTTTESSVSFRIRIKSTAQAGTYPLIFAGADDSGQSRSATLTLTIQ
jgi:hypothetical protein